MKFITTSRATVLAIFCSGLAAFAGGEGWINDFDAAKKEAATSGKNLLIEFTGSDWCGWCIRLNEEVFSHEPFKAGVKDKVVLVELDFPNNKSKQSESIQLQNQKLAESYRVEGFPTILLADPEGRPFAMTGYQAGGPEAYVSHLDHLLAKKEIRDSGFSAAAKLEGPEKAKVLVGTLNSLGLNDEVVTRFYGDVIASIKESDPTDTTGFTKRTTSREKLGRYEAELNALAEQQNFDAALVLTENTLKEGGLIPEDAQRVALTNAMIYGDKRRFDEALKALEVARALAPDSELAGRFDAFKTELEAAKANGTPLKSE